MDDSTTIAKIRKQQTRPTLKPLAAIDSRITPNLGQKRLGGPSILDEI